MISRKPYELQYNFFYGIGRIILYQQFLCLASPYQISCK